jgi:hypothetical protein
MQQNPRNLRASLTNKINKTFHKHMSTKSEYYTLLLHHLQLDDGSITLTMKLHKYLGKKIQNFAKRKKKVNVQPLEIKKWPEQKKSQKISSFWIHTNFNTFVSNKTAAMHLEEDIKWCFWMQEFLFCFFTGQAQTLKKNLTGNIRKHNFTFKKSAERLLHFQEKPFSTVHNTVLLDCDTTRRGSLSSVVSRDQKNSTESESHLNGEFLPLRDNINIA